MNLWARAKAAAGVLWRGRVSEASLEEIVGRPVSWYDYNVAGGRVLLPVYAPETRKEKNATLRTLQDHDRARNQSRVLAETNPNAIGLLQRLCAYNVGKGSSTEVQAVKEDAEPPKRLAARVRDFVKTFKRRNRWTAREKEMVHRLHVDGEFFLRFFPQKEGITQVRFVEPQNVRPPGGADAEGEWSFGIHTPDGDAEQPEAYCLHDFVTGQDEIVEAHFIVHVKINCLSNQKRGVPSLYSVEEELRGSAKLRYATREGEKNRASITYFRQHDSATREAVERAFHGTEAASALEGLGPAPDNPSTVYVEVLEPNSVIDIPKGLNPLPPPASPNSQSSSGAVDAALEAVAARFGVPVWIVSGRSDGGNFAQALVAESPFTASLQDSQAELAEVSDACQTKALEIGAEQGLLPEDVLETIDLLVSFPSPTSRNKAEETGRRKTLYEAGRISGSTWTTEEGYDPQKEAQQIAEEKATDPRQQQGQNGQPPQPGANGQAPSGTPQARYAQLTGPLREQAEWSSFEGPRGGRGWKNSKTGEVHYGDKPGGGEGSAAQPAEKPAPSQAHQGALAAHKGRQARRDAARAALDKKEKAFASAGEASRVPGYTPADEAIARSAAALSDAAAGETPSGQFSKQAADHAESVAANYASAADSLAADLATAGASEKKLARVRQAAEKGKAAIGKAGEKLQKAAEKIAKLKAAKESLPPLGERPEAPDLFDVAKELTGRDYGDLDEDESARVDAEHTKREAAAEKDGERWDKLSDKHDGAQERIDDATGGLDEARDALDEAYSDHAERLSDAVDAALEGLDEEHGKEANALDEEEADDPQPDAPDDEEEPAAGG